jgi:hypothetical protein
MHFFEPLQRQYYQVDALLLVKTFDLTYSTQRHMKMQ